MNRRNCKSFNCKKRRKRKGSSPGWVFVGRSTSDSVDQLRSPALLKGDLSLSVIRCESQRADGVCSLGGLRLGEPSTGASRGKGRWHLFYRRKWVQWAWAWGGATKRMYDISHWHYMYVEVFKLLSGEHNEAQRLSGAEQRPLKNEWSHILRASCDSRDNTVARFRKRSRIEGWSKIK